MEHSALTILVVDSRPYTRDDLVYALLEQGYRVQAVPSVAVALEVARRLHPTLVFARPLLPDGGCGALFSQLRQAHKEFPCWCIEVCWNNEVEEIWAEENPAADDLLILPCRPSDLEARIQHGRTMQARLREESLLAQKQERLRMLRHDLNNPLSAIRGSAESALRRLQRLHEGGVSEVGEVLPRVERVLRGTERIQEIMHGLKELAPSSEIETLEAFPKVWGQQAA